jgi:hypothetical protein
MAILTSITINDTGFIQLPSGTTAQRLTPSQGMTRSNSDIPTIETYDGTSWKAGREEIGLYYTLYVTTDYFTANGHPANQTAMDGFFSISATVYLGNFGIYYGAINWGDSGQTGAGGVLGPKPVYIPADGFSWQVEGFIYAPETGTYTFGCVGDDAIDVFVNGVNVANFYGGHGTTTSWTGGTTANPVAGINQFSGTINLVAGKFYTFKARMEEGAGGDGIQVGWRKPSDSVISLIPGDFFRIKY